MREADNTHMHTHMHRAPGFSLFDKQVGVWVGRAQPQTMQPIGNPSLSQVHMHA